MASSIADEVAQEILKQRIEVVADKVKERNDKDYVQKGRKYLGFTTRGGQVVCSGDAGSMAKMREYPEAMEFLKSLLHGDNTDHEENLDTDFKFESDEVEIPPCPFPLGDKENGHTHKNVEKFLVLLLNILDSGKVGGSKLSKKTENAIAPPWFTKRVRFKTYTNPSHASAEDNIEVIKGIFEYYGKDIRTHCLRLPEQEQGFPEKTFKEEEEELSSYTGVEEGLIGTVQNSLRAHEEYEAPKKRKKNFLSESDDDAEDDNEENSLDEKSFWMAETERLYSPRPGVFPNWW